MHQTAPSAHHLSFAKKAQRDWRKNKWKYMMVLPVVIFFIVFHYKPMYGIIIAFNKYVPSQGIMGSSWVGLRNFIQFFEDYYFVRVVRNTFLISFYSLIFGFPCPIILALMLNELRGKWFKRTVQTVTYIPHFISLVVICGLIKHFSLSGGVFNDIAALFGFRRSPLLQNPDYFRTIYVASSIWQEVGWSSIIYLAALSGIDQQLYEAAEIDGAGRMSQTIHITLPGIAPTVIMLLILNMGNILNVGYEKCLLLYNESTFETADIISTYVYRKGLIDADFSYSTAVGLFNSVVNMAFLITTNAISKKTADVALF